jgi:putative RecB family exonuclease
MIDHISASSLEQYERCQVQWEFRRIHNRIMPPGIAAHIGKGTHKAAEVNMKAKRVTGKDEPLDVVTDAARDGFVYSLREQGLFVPRSEAGVEKTQMEDGLKTTISMAKTYLKHIAPSRFPQSIEKTLYSTIPELPVPIMGIVDLITQDNVVSDLKTGAKKWPQTRADKSIQATVYDKLVSDFTGKPAGIEFTIIIKGKEEVQVVTTERDESDLKVLVKRIKSMLVGVESGIFNPTHPDNWWCQELYCGFFPICPWIGPSQRRKDTK